MPEIDSAPRYLRIYCGLAIFLFAQFALIVPSGYSIGAALLLLGGLYACTKAHAPLETRDFYLLLALAFFTVEGVVHILWHQLSSQHYDKTLRFLLAIPAFFLIRWTKPSLYWVWNGLIGGSIATGTLALYEKFILDVDRAQGHTQVIQFGNLSMLMALFCLAGMGWAASLAQPALRYRYLLLLTLGALAGILASLLSGSRGGWVGLPFVLIVLFKAYHGFFTLRTKILAFSALILVGAAVFYTPKLDIKQRVGEAISDVQQYKQGNSDTSVGARFEMWRGAFQLIQAKPFLGWGKDGYQPAMQDLAAQKKVSPVVSPFNHAHNEFIDQAAKHGISGLIALLALYLVPIFYFAPYLKHSYLPIRAIAVAGTLLPVCYIDFGFSQAFLTHNSGVMMYAFWLVIWAGYLRVHLKAYTSPAATEH